VPLSEGQQVELVIERPAAGGWMIAHHHGQVVLVRGAIPGERVNAWIDRAEKRLAFASTREVIEPSPDRRTAAFDPLCGGAVYAHIQYERQLALKADILQDAFTRLAHHPLREPPAVAPSPDAGYRMRARFHVRGARAGFYREGTHQLCDAAATRQMRAESVAAAGIVAQQLQALAGDTVSSIAISENIQGDQRAAHVELSGSSPSESDLDRIAESARLTGISTSTGNGTAVSAGDPVVADPLADVTAGRSAAGVLRRHAASFFQGNRFLLAALVTGVLDAVPPTGHVLDLYAGVGLFAVALAAAGHLEVTAVESDHASGADLRRNARDHAPAIDARIARVEEYLSSARPRGIHTVVVDPPRTGVSKAALDALVAMKPSRLVYVSCDPATLARDARRLLEGGYTMADLRAFDLFPNTPHIESLATFTV
jgi:23S rRNA (uracil1939-C5)-methyltransferase